jgi:purine-nucleoside phosphorylase
VGPNDDEMGPRFPATSNAYPENLRLAAKHAADAMGIDFLKTHGTYCFVSGPQYESKAECRFLRSLGGDCVGMRYCTVFVLNVSEAVHTIGNSLVAERFLCIHSTVPEIVTAHHCNMQTLCLSLITNKVVMEGDEGAPIATHAEVLEAVEKRSVQMQTLVRQIVATMREEVLPKSPPLRKISTLVPDEYYPEKRRERNRIHGIIGISVAVAAAGVAFQLMRKKS